MKTFEVGENLASFLIFFALFGAVAFVFRDCSSSSVVKCKPKIVSTLNIDNSCPPGTFIKKIKSSEGHHTIFCDCPVGVTETNGGN